MASAWERQTGQAGYCGRWMAPTGYNRRSQFVTVPKPEKREKPQRPQPSRLKSADELLAEFKARSHEQ